MMNRRRRQSLQSRLLCLATGLILLWPLTTWDAGPRTVVETSPLVSICASIINRAIGFTAGVGIAFGLLSILKKRWFCRFICPTGLILEGIGHLGLQCGRWWSRGPPLGQYAAALTLAGALIGYPVLLWMDPMAIFGSPFAIPVTGDMISGLLTGSIIGIMLIMTMLLGGVWCGRLCPLGGFQDQLAAARPIIAGGIRTVLAWLTAPPRRPGKISRTRRALIASVFGFALGLWGRNSGLARTANEDAPLRPPGALAEEHFAGVCIRCGNCTAACPAGIIRPDLSGNTGLAGLLAPTIHFDGRDYCRENCNLCTQICPSGALQALDLATKQRYIIGEALVDTSICLLTLGKKECDACNAACPYQAVSISWDDNLYVSYPSVDPGLCNGCGACEIACPTHPVKSISVWSLLPDTDAEGTVIEASRFLSSV